MTILRTVACWWNDCDKGGREDTPIPIVFAQNAVELLNDRSRSTNGRAYAFFALKANAYIRICFTMASKPLLRVGDRCSRRPMASIK